MNRLLLSFFITFLAGISTLLGMIPTFIHSKYKNKIIQVSLSFSSGVMLSISIFSLIIESFSYLNCSFFLNVIFLLIFLNIGVILFVLIEKISSKFTNNNDLYKLGILSSFSLILHNIPEGILSFITMSTNLNLGFTLCLAIALHNIPEGISIAVPIYYSTKSHNKAFFYTFVSGFSELLGGIFAYLFLYKIMNFFFFSFLLGITAGIMIYLSISELFPKSLNYGSKNISIFGLLFGFIFMFLFQSIFKL